MSIAFEGAAYLGHNGGTGSLSQSYTCSSNSNRLLVISLAADEGSGGADDISAVTYNSISATLIHKMVPTDASLERFHYFYALLNPATGANTLVISSTSNHYLIAAAADYSGVQQSAQPDSLNSQEGTAGALTLTTSTTVVAPNSWVILCSFAYNVGWTPLVAGTGATRRIYGTDFGYPHIFDSNGPVSPGSYSMTTTIDANNTRIEHNMASFVAFGTTANVAVGSLFSMFR